MGNLPSFELTKYLLCCSSNRKVSTPSSNPTIHVDERSNKGKPIVNAPNTKRAAAAADDAGVENREVRLLPTRVDAEPVRTFPCIATEAVTEAALQHRQRELEKFGARQNAAAICMQCFVRSALANKKRREAKVAAGTRIALTQIARALFEKATKGAQATLQKANIVRKETEAKAAAAEEALKGKQ